MNALDTANALDPNSFNELRRLSARIRLPRSAPPPSSSRPCSCRWCSSRCATPGPGTVHGFRADADVPLAARSATVDPDGPCRWYRPLEAIARQLGGTVTAAPGQAGGSGDISAGFEAVCRVGDPAGGKSCRRAAARRRILAGRRGIRGAFRASKRRIFHRAHATSSENCGRMPWRRAARPESPRIS